MFNDAVKGFNCFLGCGQRLRRNHLYLLALGMAKNASWSIIKETPYWVAAHKPAGMIVERNPFESPTLEDVVLEHLQVKRRSPFLGIVHRLDKVTSGVVLMAKKKSALKHLNRQFQERTVEKLYLALISGIPTEKEGVLSHWLIKDQQEKRAIISDTEVEHAKQARLRFRVLATMKEQALLEVELLTGRYHQIRAQLAAIGHPIIGDSKYDPNSLEYTKAIALHARKLTFDDPQKGRRLTLTAALPHNSWWNPFLEQFQSEML